jgi:hypothetical protein
VIDFFASETHYADHLRPIHSALQQDVRGSFLGTSTVDFLLANIDRIAVVASFKDLRKVRKTGRPVVICEHGAGQGYVGIRSGSYIGALDRDGVVGALVPGPHALERQLAAHPEIPAHAIGCPKMDIHHWAPTEPKSDPPTIAISFHWDCRLTPETRSTFNYFKSALPELARRYNLIGHAHPRHANRLEREYSQLGIEFVADFEEVLDRAQVYCVDNSSTLFEFASTGRPVVVMNGPDFRRDVDHGMRFWEFADIGANADGPASLLSAARFALNDLPEHVERRREITAKVYGPVDGKAAQRAAQALIEIAG